MSPLVSIVISTHNRAHYLREAVVSVLQQTYTHFELILCDDASSDETPQVCQEFQATDPRIRIVRHEKNIGMQANWSSGVAAARGIYFGKLDDDNHYEPTFLERLVEILETHSEVAFAFTDEWIIDESGKRNLPLTDELSQYYQRANLPSGVLVNPQLHAASQGMGINATLFRLSILREVGGFGNYGATADCELFLRLTSLRKSCAYLSERLAEYRIHETSFSTGLKGIRESEFPVQMWERYSFSDPQAEQARLERLSTSYLMLARAYALEGKLAEARQVLKKITPPLPGVKKAQLFHRIFSLPEALVRVLIKRKYSV